jgi:hypothetical protein
MPTSKIYQKSETPITWGDSGQTYAMTLQNLATVTGRQGAVHDFGDDSVVARAREFMWRFWCEFDSTTPPVVGEVVEIYWKSGDGTRYDNDDGTGDIALSSTDKLRNLLLLGVLVVDQAAADIVMSVSGGPIELPHRYGMPVIYNATADNLDNTSNASGFALTPIPMESQ